MLCEFNFGGKTIHVLSLLLLGFVMVGCGIGKNAQKRDNSNVNVRMHKCKSPGVILLSETCGVVLEMEDNMKYQVTRIEESDFSFNPGAHVWVTYEIEQDVRPSCEEVKAAVKVVCIEEVPSVEVESDSICQDIREVLAVDWMNKIIAKYDPSIVAKYTWGNRWAYSFEGKFGKVLYDCYGNLVCRTDYGETVECEKRYKQLSNRQVLLKIDY